MFLLTGTQQLADQPVFDEHVNGIEEVLDQVGQLEGVAGIELDGGDGGRGFGGQGLVLSVMAPTAEARQDRDGPLVRAISY